MKKKIPADIISKKRTFFAASLSIQKYIICPPAPICCYFKEGGLEAFYTFCRTTWFPQVVTFTGFAPSVPGASTRDQTKGAISPALLKFCSSIPADADVSEIIRASRDPHLLWCKAATFKSSLNNAELRKVRKLYSTCKICAFARPRL